MSSDIETVRTTILSQFTPETPDETYFEMWGKLAFMKQAVREMEGLLNDKATEKIQATGRDMQCGTVRKYLGTKKVTKCKDIPATLESLLSACGGDFGAMCEFLSSDPIKYGACKKALGGRYEVLFETTEKLDLKEGVAKKELLSVDTRFIKSHASAGASDE